MIQALTRHQDSSPSVAWSLSGRSPTASMAHHPQHAIRVCEDQHDLTTQQPPLTSESCELQSPRKKKTPMCLINELARYHRFQPQYRLTAESGPAHQKVFSVNLKLGEEEYSACGQSIKKAQHAAAQLALQKTKFQLPEPKLKTSKICAPSDKSVTPTVALNALAMKLSLTPIYTNIPLMPEIVTSPTTESCSYQPHSPAYDAPSDGDYLLPYQANQDEQFLNADLPSSFTQHHPRPPLINAKHKHRVYHNRFLTTVHRVALTVGTVSVTGEGPSPQAARHNAARQALEKLEQLQHNAVAIIGAQAGDPTSVIPPDPTGFYPSELKSPVSVAHELALKMNQVVEFSVLSETGPPHQRHFIVQCKFGDLIVQGEGNCKKRAKKKAAESILEELKRSYQNLRTSEATGATGYLLQPGRIKNKHVVARRKPRNLVKETEASAAEIPNGILSKTPDPISQLVQLQQGRKEKEPIFTVISEKGIPRQPEFVVQVVVGTIVATGVGPKKKDAKKAAAVNALALLGVDVLGIATEPSLNSALLSEEQTVDDGALSKAFAGKKNLFEMLQTSSTIEPTPQEKEVKATTPANTQEKSKSSSKGVRPEMRLRYLAQVLEYEVEFSDFPKGKKGEFVSLVTMNTNPPQVSHGLGSTLEEAHDNAARNMLKLIADGGLDVCSQQANDEVDAE